MLWGTDVIGSTGEVSNKGVFGGLWNNERKCLYEWVYGKLRWIGLCE